MKTLFALLMIVALAPFALATETPAAGAITDYPQTLEIVDGEIRIAERGALNFVDFASKNTAFTMTLNGKHGPFTWDTSKNIKSGGQCAVNNYIVYVFESGSKAGSFIFDQAWLKTSSSDLPNFQNYYTNGQSWFKDTSFTYSYACYSAAIQLPDNFEKSWLTKDKRSCVDSSHPDRQTDYTYQGECLKHIVSDTTSGSGTGDSTGGYQTNAEVVTEPVTFKDPIFDAESADELIGVGDTITATVTVVAPKTGKYYLEMGSQVVQGLAVVTVQGNSCNPTELWFSNQLVSLDAGENTVTFHIIPKEGVNEVWWAQVTGCGGDVVTRYNEQDRIRVGDDTDNDGGGAGALGVSFGALALFIAGVALIGLAVYLVKRK